MPTGKSKEETLKEQISLLEDLHRPLEEHWTVKSKYGLNALNSDLNFKNHLAHLEDIYRYHSFKINPPQSAIVMTPVSQLYGVNGLKSLSHKDSEERKAKRESKWQGNFQKYSALSHLDRFEKDDYLEKKHHKQSMSKGKLRPLSTPHRSASPTSPSRRSSPTRSPSRSSFPSSAEEDIPHVRRQYGGNTLSRPELIMLGLYQFNPQHQEIYNNFISMLQEFSAFDAESILEDALEDAVVREDDDLLDEFGGAQGAE